MNASTWAEVKRFLSADFKVYLLPADLENRMMDSTPCSQLFAKDPKIFREGFNPYASKFAAELLIPASLELLGSPMVTLDAEEADVWLLASCIIGRGQQGQQIAPLIKKLRQTSRFESRFTASQGGNDMGIILTGDHGPCLLRKELLSRPENKTWHDRSIYNMTMFMNEGSLRGGCYNPVKDVTVPTWIDPAFSIRNSSGCWQPLNQRKHLIYLGGKSSSPVRSRIFAMYSADPDFHSPENRISYSEYLCEMANSVFCLAPRGQAAWSPRLSEAIHAGCIPVVIADQYEPPWWQTLDYTKFALIIPEAETADLKTVIDALSKEQVATLQRHLMRAQLAFRFAPYNEPLMSSASSGDKGASSKSVTMQKASDSESENLTPLLLFEWWRRMENKRKGVW